MKVQGSSIERIRDDQSSQAASSTTIAQRRTIFSRSRRKMMRATQKLHEIGQSLWLDNITRGLLASGVTVYRALD